MQTTNFPSSLSDAQARENIQESIHSLMSNMSNYQRYDVAATNKDIIEPEKNSTYVSDWSFETKPDNS